MMSYRIQYSPETSKQYPKVEKEKPLHVKRWMTAMAALVFALWIHFYGVPDFLIPGDAEVTKAAAQTMVSELKKGSEIRDAAATFCKMILDGAEVVY